MATIKITSNVGVDMLFSSTGFTKTIVKTSTEWVKTDADGNKSINMGTNFEYDSDNWAKKGLISKTEYIDSANHSLYTVLYTEPLDLSKNSKPLFVDILAGNDSIVGGTGGDLLYGAGGKDTFVGGAGNDTFDKVNGGIITPDKLIGGTGDDQYYIDSSGDVVVEKTNNGNNDWVISYINYSLPANVENLWLIDGHNGTGSVLNNTISGNSNVNLIKGLDGNDSIIGYEGKDTLFGGNGDDSFGLTDIKNFDVIKDFNDEDDLFLLSATAFSAFGSDVDANEIILGKGITAAADKNDYLIYNQSTGAVYYDADGNGSGAKVQIALIGTNLALNNVDFLIE